MRSLGTLDVNQTLEAETEEKQATERTRQM